MWEGTSQYFKKKQKTGSFGWRERGLPGVSSKPEEKHPCLDDSCPKKTNIQGREGKANSKVRHVDIR